MFIKRLYRYNKAVCILFLVFILSFIVVNYKWGTVTTPVLQYGMYSGIFKLKDTQTVYLVEANHRMLNCAGLSLTNRDILQIYPESYMLQSRVNDDAFSTMQRYFRPVGLSGFMHYEKFHNRVNDSLFLQWYGGEVERITGEPAGELKIYEQHFTWQGKSLQPAGTVTKLMSLGN